MSAILSEQAAALRIGTILESGDGVYRIRCEAGLVTARPAAGCLLAPASGDRVLLLAGPEEEHYILSVLAREEAGARVVFPGDVEFAAPAGGMRLNAAEGVALASPGTVSVAAGRARVAGTEVELAGRDVRLAGGRLHLAFEAIRLAAENVEQTIGRLFQKLRNYTRRVEETEDVRAGTLLTRVADMFDLHSRFASLVGRKHMRIDGDQVHIR